MITPDGLSRGSRVQRLGDWAADRWARSRAYRDLRASARHPATYSEMVRYKMAFDRRPLLKVWAEKGTARDYVAAVAGERHLPVAYALTPRVDSIDFGSLPRQYVVKATHGSGAVVVVSDSADADARLPEAPRLRPWDRLSVRPGHVDPDLLRALMRHWLTQDYSFHRHDPRAPEWAYEGIPRRILVEEYLADETGGVATDYKVIVVGGVARAVMVTMNRFTELSKVYMTPDWVRVDVPGETPGGPRPVDPARPDALDEVLALAERLSAGIDCVRVDTYLAGDRLLFGELTSYHSGGELERMAIGRHLDQQWGRWWRPDYGPDRKELTVGR